jgi:hypothetical protein
VRLAATDWSAVESLSTFGAAVVAAVTVLVTLWVYSRQNRMARAANIRSLMGAVFRDSGQIVYLTFGSAIEVAESGVHEFRNKLGSSADADTFRKYFFVQQDDEFHWVVYSAFTAGYVASPAFSRLSGLWDGMDKASAELRGKLKIFNYAAKLVADASIDACYPTLSFNLVQEMRRDRGLADSYKKITNLDELTLAAATKLGQMLHDDLGPGWVIRLRELVRFVEELYAAITDMTDRSVLKLTSDRRFDWHCLSMVSASPASTTASGPAVTATERGSAGKAGGTKALRERRQRRDEANIKSLEQLLADLEPFVHAEDFAKLKNRIEICKKTYDPGYKAEQ